jgi:RHS repeat-associated protein
VTLAEIEAYTSADGGGSQLQRFDAWGNKTQSAGANIPQYGYTGREPDATGLVYYRARYYDPSIGRFVSRDPIGLDGGINLYAYVLNNPVNYTDPTGLYAASSSASFGGFGGGGDGKGAPNMSNSSVYPSSSGNPFALASSSGQNLVRFAANDVDPYSLPTMPMRGVDGKVYDTHPVPGHSTASDGMSLAVGVLGVIGAPVAKGVQAVAGAAKGSLKGVDDLVGAAAGKARSSGDIVVPGGRERAKELFRKFDAKGVGNRTIVRDKTGGGRGVEGALEDGTPLRIRMKPDGTTRIQAGEQKFIFPPN